MRAFLLCLYVLIAVSPAALAFAFEPGPDPLSGWGLGRIAGLLGFSLLALQVATGSRMKLLDRVFGLDLVVAFHKRMGIVCGLLILAHPILLAAGMGSTYLFSFQTGWEVNLGKAAFAALFLTVAMAMFRRALKIDYNTWLLFHKGAVLVVIAGFVHALLIGSDLQTTGMRIYWSVLLGMTMVSFANENILRPLVGRHRFRVASVHQETHNTWTLRLAPEKGGEVFSYRPGQFAFLKLIRQNGPSEEHPFTISSSPTQRGEVCFTIKESGDFTRTIGKTRAGDGAALDAPFGRFSFTFDDPRSMVFVAGGVGITPLMSMLRYLRDTGDTRPVRLICGNKLEKDIIFREEIEALPENVKTVHVLSGDSPGWQGPRGRVTRETLERHAGDILDEAGIYVCGPPPMMSSVIKALKALGTGPDRIHSERFAL